jgi:hypothetical protein
MERGGAYPYLITLNVLSLGRGLGITVTWFNIPYYIESRLLLPSQHSYTSAKPNH